RHTRFSRDWSSDVCSSDLRAKRQISRGGGFILKGGGWYSDLYSSTSKSDSKSDASSTSSVSAPTESKASSDSSATAKPVPAKPKIGRASCRERTMTSGALI